MLSHLHIPSDHIGLENDLENDRRPRDGTILTKDMLRPSQEELGRVSTDVMLDCSMDELEAGSVIFLQTCRWKASLISAALDGA